LNTAKGATKTGEAIALTAMFGGWLWAQDLCVGTATTDTKGAKHE
jgi:hypothetical protein